MYCTARSQYKAPSFFWNIIGGNLFGSLLVNPGKALSGILRCIPGKGASVQNGPGRVWRLTAGQSGTGAAGSWRVCGGRSGLPGDDASGGGGVGPKGL